MRKTCAVGLLLASLLACGKGSGRPSAPLAIPDAGAVPPDDAGAPVPEGPPVDGGTPVDAGTPDAGPPIPPEHRMGGLGAGPFPKGPLIVYGSGQGLLEAPISASIDEGENLWVVSEQALYLLEPGARTFRRYTAQDGLHYGPGFTEPPDITLVEGGAKGECFVGYSARDTNTTNLGPNAHMWNDPWAHMGKMDQVLLQRDGTLKVNRYDLRNSNDGRFYETRTIMSMVYDHFQHPGNLYVGSNHGVTRIIPAKYFPPRNPLDFDTHDERQWYADHVHPVVCMGGFCDGTHPITFGDQFGLTLAPDGRLWMAGLTTAGAVHFRESLDDWVQSWIPFNPFDPAFGDGFSVPVFPTPVQGEPVNLRAVTVTSDGVVWFASGGAESWRVPHRGMASWDGRHFLYFDPTALGSIEFNILEMVALPDDRLVLGFPSTGLLVWKPGDRKGHRLTVNDGLPGERIGRVKLDRLHDPPILLVPTDGGLLLMRQVP